jgi:hypothetical protein
MLKHSSSRVKKVLAILFSILFVISTTAVAVSAHRGSPYHGPSGIGMHQLINNPGGMGYLNGFVIAAVFKFKQAKDNHPTLFNRL